jgi:PRD1 phage membrane DNA delivery
MENQLVNSVVTVLTAIVGLAIIAVLVSNNANTSGVITAGSKGFAADIAAAVAPVTSGSSFGSEAENYQL